MFYFFKKSNKFRFFNKELQPFIHFYRTIYNHFKVFNSPIFNHKKNKT